MNLAPLDSLLLTVFAWAWKTSLASVVLIGLVLLVQFIFQKFLPPRWRYALWLLVVVRMLMPAIPASRYSIFNSGRALAIPVPLGSPVSIALPPAQERSGEPMPPPHFKREEARVNDLRSSRGDSAHYSPAKDQSRLTSAATIEGGASASHTRVAAHTLASAPMLWLLGVLGYFLTVFTQHHKLSSWLESQKPVVSPRLTSLIQEARHTLGLRQEVPVVETNSRRAAAVFGFLRPRLLLSKATLDQLNDLELRLVILHELVHSQRRDVLLNWLIILLQALHWFNPLVWLAMRRLRSDRELVCDALVMRHLTVDERHAYGSTLIKMLDSFSNISLVPSLIPILNHKHEIHRRITMIAHYKPTARLVTLASALLLLALGCFTFTIAAEKTPPQAAEKSKEDAELDKQREAHQRGMKILEEELDRREDEVRKAQQTVDGLKERLQIPDSEEVGQGKQPNEPGSFLRLEGLRIEAFAEFTQIDTLYSLLTNLTRLNFKKAILTVVPDPTLVELFNHQALTEQELANLLENYGSDHPEVKRKRKISEIINGQIDQRLEGILIGLRAKRDSIKAKLETLQAEGEKIKRTELEKSVNRRPYFQAKRDLDNLQYIREKLMMRLIQEKIDAAIPK